MSDHAEAIPQAATDAFQAAVRDEWNLPYMARASAIVTADSTGEQRERELEALRAADDDAERRNDEVVRRGLAAAIPHLHGTGCDCRAVIDSPS